MLNEDQKILLNLIMNFVNDADKHKIDDVSIEQKLTDILTEMEFLTMSIDDGKYEKDRED